MGVAHVQLNGVEAQLLHLPGIADPVFQGAGGNAADDHHAVAAADAQQFRSLPGKVLHGQHGAAPGEEVVLLRIIAGHGLLVHAGDVDAGNACVLQGRGIGNGLGDDAAGAAGGEVLKPACRAGDVGGRHDNGAFKAQPQR